MSREDRTARLVHARRVAAANKRKHALKVLTEQVAAGERVTFAGVARTAAVSGWFVRNQPDLRQAIDRAMAQQREHGLPDKRTTHTSDPGLRADLLLAREEIRELRAERDKLNARLRKQLGAELDHEPRRELLARLTTLTAEHQHLTIERDALKTALSAAESAKDAIGAEIDAARAANRRLMRQLGRPDQSA